MKRLLPILGLLLACTAVQAAMPTTLKLAANKKTNYVIAIAAKPLPSEVTASRELQSYLFQITGVKFPIGAESSLKTGSPAIMVGQTKYALSKGLWTKEPEKWIIKTVNNRLVLTGGRPRGTLYAVYHFLEDVLGVRWWTIWDQTVPTKTVLTINQLDVSGQPALKYRDIYDAELPWPKEFYARNRVNGHYSFVPWSHGGTIQYGPPYHVHTFNLYFPPDEYFDKHPEYFSLSKGERIRNGQLCLTNEDMRREWISKMKNYIRTSYAEADSQGTPRPRYFSISQNDWEGSCECENCQAIYEKEGHSGLSLMFVNSVAEEIEKEFPNALVDTLAYWFYEEAPKTIKPRDNVRIRLCDVGEDVMHPITHSNNHNGLRRLEDWAKITKNLDIWKYGVIYSANLPTPTMLDYADDVRAYQKYGVDGAFVELENIMTTDMWEMKAWMLAKLYENPNLDSTKLVKDFTDGYYGAAGKYIREYLYMVHDALQKKPSYLTFGATPAGYGFLTLDVVRKSQALFDKAEAAIAKNPTLLDRVRLARTSVDRAVCYRWGLLNREHRISGKGDIGLDFRKSADRAASIIEKLADKRFANNKGFAKHAYDQAAILRDMTAFNKPVKLPPLLAALPLERVFDLSPRSFRLAGPGIGLVDDPDAVYETAVKLDLASTGSDAAKYKITPTQSMPMGVYNAMDKSYGKTASVTYDQIKPGYNYYKLDSVKITSGEYFYLFWSWVIQADLDSAMADSPDQLFDIYVSIKFEGPSFPNGDPAKPDAILVERVTIVQLPK